MLRTIILALSGAFLPLDHDLVPPVEVATGDVSDIDVGEIEEEAFLIGTASWYDYSLPKYSNGADRSKTHSTCAVRVVERYQTYKVCSDVTGICIECYHNDY